MLMLAAVACHAQNDQYVYLRRYIAQIADGDSWKTTFTIVNGSGSSIAGTLRFFDSTGRPMPLPIRQGTAQRTTDSFKVVVMARGTATVETAGASSALSQGYATFMHEMGGTAYSSVFATYSSRQPGASQLNEATITADWPQQKKCGLPFDNSNGFATGMGILNPDSIRGDFLLKLTDEAGNEILTKALSLASLKRAVFAVAQQYPETAGRRGYLEVSRVYSTTPTNPAYPHMLVMGLRFSPGGTFSAMPVIRTN